MVTPPQAVMRLEELLLRPRFACAGPPTQLRFAPRARAISIDCDRQGCGDHTAHQYFVQVVSTIAASVELTAVRQKSYGHTTVGSSNSNDMVAEPVVLWTDGPVQCVVLHHSQTRRYRVQIVVRGRVFIRRWFDRSEDAATYATELAAQFGASGVDAASVRSSAARAR